jgi:hypothetical protein
MKLEISKEECLRLVEVEGDHEVGAGTMNQLWEMMCHWAGGDSKYKPFPLMPGYKPPPVPSGWAFWFEEGDDLI